MEQCRLDHFDDLPKTNQNWTRLFENNALSDYLCPRYLNQLMKSRLFPYFNLQFESLFFNDFRIISHNPSKTYLLSPILFFQ